ncbi:MAG: PKD domain-containing protein [Flavobacteriales bacterium]|nr:PKD domain-containing protein [Flavobacteriales bacterium]
MITFGDQSSTDVIAWYWAFPQGVPTSSTQQDPQVNYPGDRSGEYPVELIVTNSYGCADTARSLVRVDGVFSVYVPNAFTPDADGINDDSFP